MSIPRNYTETYHLRENFWGDHTEAPCFYCKKIAQRATNDLNEKITIDHVIPVSKGGVNCVLNFVPACFRCNNRRGNMGMLSFIFLINAERY